MIYVPTGRAREYGDLACNIYRRCTHRCAYCYCPGTLHVTKEDFFQEPWERKDLLRELEHDIEKMKLTGPVFLSFIGDVYQPAEEQFGLTRQVIRLLHEYDIPVRILTKGAVLARRDFDLLGPRDEFGVTLTFDTQEESRKWEQGAALPRERLASLQFAHAIGIPTWVSFEPVIDPGATLRLVDEIRGIADRVMVGKWNHDKRAATINWNAFSHRAEEKLKWLGIPYMFKKDLREVMA